MEGQEETVEEKEAGSEATEASLEELMAKKEGDGSSDDGGDDDTVVATEREGPVEPLSVKVVPQQPTEFTCRNCFLVKHRSQLADKKRMYCRDCV
jgi:hypothetical protein